MKSFCFRSPEPDAFHRLLSKSLSVAVFAVLLVTIGCQSGNFYYADSMPHSLRLTSQSNPQEADLSRLASASGGSETIGPGDVLEVSISASLSKDDQVTIPVRVSDDGTASVPDIGSVVLSGVEPHAAESLIRMEAIRKGLYRNPTVTVSVAHKKMNRVRVLGAVKEAGTYELTPNASDVVSAIAAAGGLSEDAGENVEIRNPLGLGSRPGGSGQTPYSTVSSSGEESSMSSYRINLISAAKSGTNSYVVQDGGVVMVEKRDPATIKVLGLVHKPDEYPFPVGKDITVLGAIALAGGTNNQLADRVYVIRPLSNSSDPAVIQVSIRKAKKSGKSNILLGPGDIVSVEQTPGTVLMQAMELIRFGVSGTAPLF
ncbi:MAG: polysaccharide biosynthesis/export family protein [Planctomycetaceae bacterium]|nr:polysaccharide biosynthesis/export family protein [Planctomycetaceae bacterium]